MRRAHRTRPLLVAAAALAALPATALAQQKGQFSVDARAGIAFPSGNLNDLSDVGPSIAGTIAYHLSPIFALRTDVGVDLFGAGASQSGFGTLTGLDLLHVSGGFEADFARPEYQDTPLTFSINVGAGITRMDADPFTTSTQTVDFTETYFTVNGGASVGYDVSSNVNLFVRGEAYLILTDATDTAIFTSLSPAVSPFDTAWSIPVSFGIRITSGHGSGS